ncbi:MAG TPA: alpha/beta hydrolase, partial [Albitalea sp.]|nr:alpha/beta hydrolase [Albitalea sp.]
IVGGADAEVLQLNRAAYKLLQCEKRIDIVPRATHLFQEAGTLETVAELASAWFLEHLRAAA